MNRRDFLKLAGIGVAIILGYLAIDKLLYYYRMMAEIKKSYYQIYIEGGTAKALNVKKNTIDYQSSDHVTVIQDALNNIPVRHQEEKVSLLGDFIVSDTIKIPSFTIFELDGSIKLADKVDKILVQEIDPVRGNTNITMKGGTYDGNKTKQITTATQDHVIKFSKVTDSHFSNMTIQNAVNDNFTLDIGCNNNICEKLTGRYAGTGNSSSNDGNGLIDRGDRNTWIDCIAEDNYSDNWVIKCRNSIFKNCIGRGSKNAVGFGLFADRNITGNRFEACHGYNNKTTGMTLNIPSKSDGRGIILENNFIQGEFYNNGTSGIRFIDTTTDGSCRDNVVDILTYDNKEIGFFIQDGISNNTGSIVAINNKSSDIDIQKGSNNNFDVNIPSGKTTNIKQGNNKINKTNFDCNNVPAKFCTQRYCQMSTTPP